MALHLVDLHTHTSTFSFDGKMTHGELMATAHKQRLDAVGTAEHYDVDEPTKGSQTQLFSIDAYLIKLQEMRDIYTSGPRLLGGIELGYFPYLSGTYADLVNQYPFDYVMMSNHRVGGIDPYNDRRVYDVDKKTILDRYINELADMVCACPYIDILAHYDYIMRFAPYEDRHIYYHETPTAFDRLFKQLIEHDVALEINTGTMRALNMSKKTTDPYPDKALLKRYIEMGGKKITLGSDAHTKEDIGYLFLPVIEHLRACGLFKLYTFEKRMAIAYCLH